MGWFDGAMGNKKESDFEPVRPAVQPVKGQVLITFQPSGLQVNAKPGQFVKRAIHSHTPLSWKHTLSLEPNRVLGNALLVRHTYHPTAPRV